jgi:hypothetical protein
MEELVTFPSQHGARVYKAMPKKGFTQCGIVRRFGVMESNFVFAYFL